MMQKQTTWTLRMPRSKLMALRYEYALTYYEHQQPFNSWLVDRLLGDIQECNDDKDPDEVYKDVTEAVEEVRDDKR